MAGDPMIELYDKDQSDARFFVVVRHDANADEPRPPRAELVYWFGTVAPVNMVDGDLWLSE